MFHLDNLCDYMYGRYAARAGCTAISEMCKNVLLLVHSPDDSISVLLHVL
jgi:hypothetical protein